MHIKKTFAVYTRKTIIGQIIGYLYKQLCGEQNPKIISRNTPLSVYAQLWAWLTGKSLIIRCVKNYTATQK